MLLIGYYDIANWLSMFLIGCWIPVEVIPIWTPIHSSAYFTEERNVEPGEFFLEMESVTKAPFVYMMIQGSPSHKKIYAVNNISRGVSILRDIVESGGEGCFLQSVLTKIEISGTRLFTQTSLNPHSQFIKVSIAFFIHLSVSAPLSVLIINTLQVLYMLSYQTKPPRCISS